MGGDPRRQQRVRGGDRSRTRPERLQHHRGPPGPQGHAGARGRGDREDPGHGPAGAVLQRERRRPGAAGRSPVPRSEERRVGKEWRSRGGTEHVKKKTKCTRTTDTITKEDRVDKRGVTTT